MRIGLGLRGRHVAARDAGVGSVLGHDILQRLTLIVLAVGFVAVLTCNLPGHLSYDSVIQLHDGRTGGYNTWHPPIMAWVLGLCDAVLPGSALFVVLDAGLLFGSLAALTSGSHRPSWAAPVVALCLALSPLILIYQGIVWKDVFFADASVTGFVALSLADRSERRTPRILMIVFAFGMFALATLIRQNGVAAPIAGAGAVVWMVLRQGGRKALMRGIGFGLLALMGVAAVVIVAGKALDTRRIDAPGPAAQFKALQEFDLVGGVAHDPKMDLSDLAAVPDQTPGLDARVRSAAIKFYTPQRVDTLAAAPGLDDDLAAQPRALSAQWRDMLRHDFPAYAHHRWDAFYWTIATPELKRCLPVFVGVAGMPNILKALNISAGQRPQDVALSQYAAHFYGTPIFSHLTYGVIAILAALMLLRSNRPGDAAMAFMLLGALLFTASFLPITIACDYRYLYMLDVSAMVSLFYLAVRGVDLRLTRVRRAQ